MCEKVTLAFVADSTHSRDQEATGGDTGSRTADLMSFSRLLFWCKSHPIVPQASHPDVKHDVSQYMSHNYFTCDHQLQRSRRVSCVIM